MMTKPRSAALHTGPVKSGQPSYVKAFLSVQIDFLGESTTGNLRFVQRVKSEGIVNVLGLQQLDDIITIPYRELKRSQQVLGGTA